MAYFSPGDGDARASDVDRMEAIGNVLISTPQDIVRARRGDYNPNTGIATLTGDVKITRGDNQMNGEFAEVNLNTGISRITGGDQDGGRVKGLVLPTARTRPNELLGR
jgi:lipopolysaccharide export system protein LptA